MSKFFEVVPADAWIDDRRLRDDIEVEELSIALPRYNQVLSFLYVDQVNEEYEEDEYLEELDGYPKFRK